MCFRGHFIKSGSRPVSRVLSWTAIPLGCTSPCTSSNLPGNHAGRMIVPLFGLAPGGVFPATSVARRAVRSYRTISPLPAPECRRYIFCGTFRRLAPPRRYLAPCPVEPGLSSRKTGRNQLLPVNSRHGIEWHPYPKLTPIPFSQRLPGRLPETSIEECRASE